MSTADQLEPKSKLPLWIAVGVIGLVSIIALMMWGLPQYKVWQRDLSGQATLAEQEWEKKVMVEEAKAEYEAAKHHAKAEVERAKGVAEANEIIGESLKNNEAYLRYLWIQSLHDEYGEIIYVPTEANMPIMEAGRAVK